MLVTGGKSQTYWQAVGINHDMDLCRQPSAGSTERFGSVHFDASGVLVLVVLTCDGRVERFDAMHVPALHQIGLTR